jgi:hypothetical protein
MQRQHDGLLQRRHNKGVRVLGLLYREFLSGTGSTRETRSSSEAHWSGSGAKVLMWR